MPHSSMVWRFDSVDLQAGIGFASLRPAIRRDDDSALVNNPSRPMLYCAAPDFALVPIADPALAYNAGRSGLSFPLFFEDEELGFEAVDDLRSFLRRAYIRRHDDGPSDGGPANPVPPPDGGGDDARPRPFRDDTNRDRPRQRHSSAADTLLISIERFNSASAVTRPVGSSPASWSELLAAKPSNSLEYGMVLIFRELIRQFPYPVRTEHLLQWQMGVRALGEVVSRLELYYRGWIHWDPVAAAYAMNSLMPALSTLWRDRVDPSTALEFLLFSNTDVDAVRPTRFASFNRQWSSDKLLILQLLPMPDCRLAREMRNAGRRPTLLHLISSFCASPAVFYDIGEDRRVPDSVILGAAFLCATDDGSPRRHRGNPWKPGSALSKERKRRRFSLAMAWLAQQLPDRAFSASVERIIGEKVFM